MKLRAYQNSAVERVLALFARGVRRVLLVLPTGGGKTVIFSELVRICLEKYGPAIVLAHRRELIKQTFAKLVRNGLPVGNVGIIMAGVPFRASSSFLTLPPEQCTDDELWTFYALRRPAAGVHVGSIDTFRNVSKPAAKLIVVDEAHRALAASYQAVQRDYPDAFHLGVTATPFRADGKGLGEAYDEIVVAATYQDLVDDPDGPFLVIPDCYGTEKKADLSAIKKAGGDYNAKQLAHAVDKGELIGDLVEHWIKLGNNAPTFAFAVNVAHSMHIARRFCEAGIPAKHVDGNTETNERDLAIQELRAGKVKILSNCDVFTEGTDVPSVKTIILARPTLSERIYLQQVGRGSRPFEGRPFVVLDHAGCCTAPQLGGLPHWPREYTLEGRKEREKKTTVQLPPAKDCPECFAICPIAMEVCTCGYKFPVVTAPTEPPKETDGQLVKLEGTLTEAQAKRLAGWNELVEEWRRTNEERAARGEKKVAGGWCSYEWRNRTGQQWPPKGSTLPKLTPEELAENERIDEAKKAAKRAAPVAAAPPGAASPTATSVPPVVAPRRFKAPSGPVVLEDWSL